MAILSRSVVVALAILASVVSSSPAAIAPGKAIVRNLCKVPVTLLSVAGTNQGNAPTPVSLPPGGNYSETFQSAAQKGGISIKLKPEAKLLANVGLSIAAPPAVVLDAAETIFAYTFDDTAGTVFYDLSSVFGDPFAGTPGNALAVIPTLTSCQSINWPNATNPGGSSIRSCSAATDLEMFLCTVVGKAAEVLATPLSLTKGKTPGFPFKG